MDDSVDLDALLWSAVEKGDFVEIEALLGAGSDPFAKRFDGLDAFDYSRQRWGENFFNRFLSLVAQLGASKSILDSDGIANRRGKRTDDGKSEETNRVEFLEEFHLYFDYETYSQPESVVEKISREGNPREDTEFSDNFEAAQEFGRESFVTSNPDFSFRSSVVALQPSVDVADVFEDCLNHFNDFPLRLKSIVVQWLYAIGAQGSAFGKLDDETRQQMEYVSGISDYEALCQAVRDFEESLDPCCLELFEYLDDGKSACPNTELEYAVASFIKILMCMHGEAQAND